MGFWLDKTAFVTGATGFVGGHLVEHLLHRGTRVIALMRDGTPESYLHAAELATRCVVVRGDLADRDLLERILGEYSVTHVFHLASQSQVGVGGCSPVGTFEANIRGTWNLLEACRRIGGSIKRIMTASSDKAYGDLAELPAAENAPLNGLYPYDVSKACADRIAQSYHATYGLPVNIIRSANVYGPGDFNWARLIPNTIRKALARKPVVLRGGGHIKREYVYVQDEVMAYMLAARHEQDGHAFNIGSGVRMTAHEVVMSILLEMALCGNPAVEPIIQESFEGEIRDQAVSSDKARDQLGWAPQVEFLEGLRLTIGWYRRYLCGLDEARFPICEGKT